MQHNHISAFVYHICKSFEFRKTYVKFLYFSDLFAKIRVGSVSFCHTLIGCADSDLVAYWPKVVTCTVDHVAVGGTYEAERGSGCRGRCGS